MVKKWVVVGMAVLGISTATYAQSQLGLGGFTSAVGDVLTVGFYDTHRDFRLGFGTIGYRYNGVPDGGSDLAILSYIQKFPLQDTVSFTLGGWYQKQAREGASSMDVLGISAGVQVRAATHVLLDFYVFPHLSATTGATNTTLTFRNVGIAFSYLI